MQFTQERAPDHHPQAALPAGLSVLMVRDYLFCAKDFVSHDPTCAALL